MINPGSQGERLARKDLNPGNLALSPSPTPPRWGVSGQKDPSKDSVPSVGPRDTSQGPELGKSHHLGPVCVGRSASPSSWKCVQLIHLL